MRITSDKKKPTPKDIFDMLGKMSDKELQEEADLEFMEIEKLTERDIISLYDFFQYLISNEQQKRFVTTSESLVAKHRKVLKEKHNCNIIVGDLWGDRDGKKTD